MTSLPDTVQMDGTVWFLGVRNGEPIYTCKDPLIDFASMKPTVEAGGQRFHYAYDTGVGYHYYIEKPPVISAALQMMKARTKIFAANRSQNHLLKLLAETQDPDKAAAALEAIFLIERDREANRRYEKEARKQLYEMWRNLNDINIDRPKDALITEDEEATFLQFDGKIIDDYCKKLVGRDEKRKAVEAFDRARRQREEDAFALLREAGYAEGIAILEALPEERQHNAKSREVRRK